MVSDGITLQGNAGNSAELLVSSFSSLVERLGDTEDFESVHARSVILFRDEILFNCNGLFWHLGWSYFLQKGIVIPTEGIAKG